eukprot:CAMPEP_0172503058 /NCGR_PEP_ID=MMETSP1066-20121228/165492_1 /TAXON_ID=671091 /ORGANISM="Coscinodiscus wailesii, Strain CCMP2513" /LENGTH=92 /DNA_ID=CAMNT_0013278615 /DNA_START=238 /DNA_END=513 /DNA_ORIENTATION=-
MACRVSDLRAWQKSSKSDSRLDMRETTAWVGIFSPASSVSSSSSFVEVSLDDGGCRSSVGIGGAGCVVTVFVSSSGGDTPWVTPGMKSRGAW